MEKLNVKVGDKVLYESGYSYDLTEKIVEVIKITPTGRIKISGSDKQYDMYGFEMGKHNVWARRTCIKELTAVDVERIERKQIISKALRLISGLNHENLNYEKALKIIEILNI